MEKYFVSICIPSYNRPIELKRLLKSIDCEQSEIIEIVICEDRSPKRPEIKETVEEYMKNSPYQVSYYENEINLGYDNNIRELINKAQGEYIVFMGDDDLFIPGVLDGYLDFLNEHHEVGYVLRSYRAINKDGLIEYFKYYSSDMFFEKGENTYLELFRKSVFISGFTCKREWASEYLVDDFDGTLLYQLYILAELCMHHPAAYYSVPITQSIEGGTPYFGTSEKEKDLYTPGTITVQNSLNFMQGFFIISGYMDKKYNLDSTKKIKTDISKYSYPILSIQRNKGVSEFKYYCRELRKLDIDCTIFFNIYYIGLLIMGTKRCDNIIKFIKKVLGKTPKL